MSDKEQEPVAVVSGYYGGHCVILPLNPARIFNANTALYTTPPERKWVDLTATEVKILRNASNTDREFAALVIAKFKEKNT